MFGGASLFSNTETALPPFAALSLEGDTLAGSLRAGEWHYAVLPVPASLAHVVLDAHSCSGDVDLVVTQVAAVSTLSPRSFPTLQRHEWSRFVHLRFHRGARCDHTQPPPPCVPHAVARACFALHGYSA